MKLKKLVPFYLRMILLIINMFPFFLKANDSIAHYKPKQLVKDFNFLIKKVKEVHPDCYAYVSENDLNKAEKESISKLNKNMTRQEFFKIIAPFFGLLKDGHSQLWIPSQDRNKKAIKNILFFPLKIEFNKQNTCYIKKNLSSDTILCEGDELLTINNLPIEKVRDSLLLFFNGERQEFKIKVLENMYFELLLWYIYDFKNSFNIEYLDSKNKELKKTSIKGISFDKVKSQGVNPDLIPKEKLKFRLSNDSSIAIFTIKSFDGNKTEFINFYKSCFEKIKENSIQNLIIDIRENGGGNSSNCDTLLRYLTDSAFSQFSALEIKNNHKAKHQFKREIPFLFRPIPFSLLFPKTKNNCYLIKNSFIKPKNNPLRFHGNIYVLTSEFTFSSASNFACTIKDFKIGKIIGQESGGLASCYGPALGFKLPNTKIAFQISYQHVLRPAGYDDGHGVIPDFIIEDDKWTDEQYYKFVFNLVQKQ
jgi:hypothetical protein